MKKLIDWLENSFSPQMMKVNQNVWVTVLKDSVMQTMPFILLGSFLCMFTIPGDIFKWSWWPNFWTPFGWSMGMISLFVSFLVPFNLMERLRLRKQRIIAGLSGVVLFLIIITPQVVADKAVGFNHSALGAGGMFIALIAGLATGLIMKTVASFSFFKEDSVIPEFVRAWFDSLLPISVVTLLGWVTVDILRVDVYNMVIAVFSPLGAIVESPLGFVLTMFIFTFLYSMGISSWVLTPVITPVLLAATAANVKMLQAGIGSATALNLVTSETIYSAYLWMGGIGCTLPLVFMLIRSKSSRLQALGKACLGPSIFNINEPVVFGCIVWNPIMMLPMWLQAVALPLTTYVFTKLIPLAPIPSVSFHMWYCPFPISTWLITGSLMGVSLMLLSFVIASGIWYPFFKVYEAQEVAVEARSSQEATSAPVMR